MTEDRKIKVLLLDDEKMLLQLYQMKFEHQGYEVSTFSNSDDALIALRNGYEPDVILFDITMPDSRSGYEFLDITQKENLGPHSLKIALTNEGQDGEIHRLVELGADAHLLKANYTPAELVATVAQMFGEKKV